MSAKPKALDPGYEISLDGVDKMGWEEILGRFSDANIYQTWSYDAIRCGEENLSHLVLHRRGEIAAVAQVRLARIPLIGMGAAYCRWAPLWKPRAGAPKPEVLRQTLRAMRNEYVCRRRLILRIFPLLFDDEEPSLPGILSEEGYRPVAGESRGRTLIMDIRSPLDELRKKFDQKWRNCLNRSERNGLEVVEGTDDSLFAEFIGLYRALLDRKKFEEPNDINEFRRIQESLPAGHKMRIFLCRSGGASSAGVICGAVGDTGVYLFGATNEEGMTNKGSYLLQWKVIQSLKDKGCAYYNLNGINPEKNPGGYHFKAGLLGKNGRDLHYLGRFDNYVGRLTAGLARVADAMMPVVKRAVGK